MSDKLILSDIGENSNVRIYKRTHEVLNSLADRTGMSVEIIANALICLAAIDFDSEEKTVVDLDGEPID